MLEGRAPLLVMARTMGAAEVDEEHAVLRVVADAGVHPADGLRSIAASATYQALSNWH